MSSSIIDRSTVNFFTEIYAKKNVKIAKNVWKFERTSHLYNLFKKALAKNKDYMY